MKTTLPLRVSIPLALALLGAVLTGVDVAHDRAGSYQNVERTLRNRAVLLCHIVVPTMERALLQGDNAAAEDTVERLALEPNLSLALVCDDTNQVLYTTDFVLRNQNLSATSAAAAQALIAQARATMIGQSEITADGASVQTAFPFYFQALPGELSPSRVAVLYTRTDLLAPKREELAGILDRALLLGALALLACFLAWFYLRTTFTRHLDKLVAGVAAYDADKGNLRVPTEGNPEVTQIGRVLNRLFADLEAEQAALRRLNGELQVSEEKYRVVADFTYDWETWIDLDRKFIYVSPSCKRITGYTSDEFIGDSSLYARIVHPDDREVFEKHLEEMRVESAPVCRVEFRIITRNGEERWIEHLCGNIFGSDGKWLGQRSNNRDITDRKRMEESLHRLNRELRAISNCNQTLLRAKDEQTLLNDICRIVCDEAGYRMAWAGYAEHDDTKTVRPVA